MITLSYCDPDGARHEVRVRETAGGAWQVLDTGADAARVIEMLDGREDGRPQAEAIARDYLRTVERLFPAAGRQPGEPIPEQGGTDVHSDHPPTTVPRAPRARGVALPRPAG